MFQLYLANFISIFTQILIFAIFARVILSWLRVTPRGFLFNMIVQSTEPILNAFRRIVPPVGGILDVSPVLAIIALNIISSLLIGLIRNI